MAQAQGKIVQCIGAVVDVEFPRDTMPHIYDALKMEGSSLTLEVQQQLGDGVVRTIALGSSDGLRRGMVVYNTLGHCRGHYDLPGIQDFYPNPEKCAWNYPVYYELLRRGITWAKRLDLGKES